MKKIYGILFLLALMAFKNLHAQNPCSDITVTIIQPMPQTGAHNYYGVRVSLAQTYGQDVTVTGYIHAESDEANNQDHPFTLTIGTGNLSEETAVNFYETDPTGGADVTIASVTPCPADTRGNDVDLGAMHNQVVDYIDSYNFTGKSDSVFLDDVFYYTTSIVDPTSIPNARGIWGIINFCGQADPGGLGNHQTLDSVIILLKNNDLISASSKAFLDSLVSETGNNVDYSAFVTRVNGLESGYSISSLPLSEKLIVQGALSVFRQSASYWNNYYDSTEDTEDPRARFSLRFRCFLCVVKNDLKGILLGFLVGNCICTKLGVVNPWICGAVGAVAFGSLYSWAAKVCPDVCTRCRKPSTSSYPSWICHLPFLHWP